MSKIIRITEEQLRRIEENTFTDGLDTTSEIPEYPQSQSTTSGKMNDDEFAKPITTDDLADKMCKNFPWGYGGYFRNLKNVVYEDNNKDNSGDGVPDMFNHKDANILNDGDESDDQQVIPYSVDKRLDSLIYALKGLAPKKLSMSSTNWSTAYRWEHSRIHTQKKLQ